MTKSQKLAIRASEIRSKLNELNGKPDLSDEERAEMAKLTEEYGTVETEWRASTIAESAELETRAANDDAEGRERRELRNRASVGAYLRHAHSGQAVTGAEAELSQAEKVATVGPNGGALIPWAALEVRAAPVEPARTRFPRRGCSMGRSCNGLSCNGCSVAILWTRLACGSIACRRAGRNGRC